MNDECMNISNPTLAQEIYEELRYSGRKWFILFLVSVVVYVLTLVVFVAYIAHRGSSAQQEAKEINQSNVIQVIGGDLYGEDKTECP